MHNSILHKSVLCSTEKV